MKRQKNNLGFTLLLNLILPGAGHVYRREYLFGLFVFLILLVAATLFLFSFLVVLPESIKPVLFGLPAIFYVFSFVDLWRTVKREKCPRPRSLAAAWLFLFVAVTANLLTPLSPVNFLLRNAPEVMVVKEIELTPVLKSGDVCWVDRLAYRADLFFLEAPITRRDPGRWDLIRFRDSAAIERFGLVVGLPGEEVALFNDSLFVDGYPAIDPSDPFTRLAGRVPLTLAAPDGILAVTLNNGVVDRVHRVPVRDIIGRGHRLF